jgi:hypothetical protein
MAASTSLERPDGSPALRGGDADGRITPRKPTMCVTRPRRTSSPAHVTHGHATCACPWASVDWSEPAAKEFPVTEIQTTTTGSLPHVKTLMDAFAARPLEDGRQSPCLCA